MQPQKKEKILSSGSYDNPRKVWLWAGTEYLTGWRLCTCPHRVMVGRYAWQPYHGDLEQERNFPTTRKRAGQHATPSSLLGCSAGCARGPLQPCPSLAV